MMLVWCILGRCWVFGVLLVDIGDVQVEGYVC